MSNFSKLKLMGIKKTTYLIFVLFTALSCSNDKAGSNSTHTKTDSQTASGFETIPSSHSGIDFVNALKDDPLSEKNVLSFQHYFNGAGVGVADFNNDGLADVFFAGNEVPNALYVNKGDFKFEKLDTTSGINQNKVWAAGVSIVDINGDGYKDIYVCQQGPYDPAERKNLFYINNGDLTFKESAAEMGLDDSNFSTQAAFFDYDKDGDLDCYVLDESKYVGVVLAKIYKELENETNMRAASGKLYENTGNLKFKDVTKEAGVLNYGYGLGLSISDLNGDNWPDIYVANDYTVPDFMYINQKDGTFKESVKDFTRQISYFAMGCDIADINNDGLVDIGVVDMAAEDHFRDKTLMAGMDTEAFKYYFYELGYQFQYMFNSLQLNNGNNTFSNIAALAGVLKSDWSWAAIFSDFNLDGHKDYYVTNGFRRYSRDNDFRNRMKEIRAENNNTIPLEYREEVYKLMPEIKLKNKLYINDGHLHFKDNHSDFKHPEIETFSSGAATADFDNDGDLDVIISNIDQEVTLLKNTAVEKSGRNYIKISLKGQNEANTLGSKVYVETNKNTQLQEYIFVRGYESTMEDVIIFGLGSSDKINSIKVVWPDGNQQIESNITPNQHLKIAYRKETNIANQKEVKAQGLLTSLSPEELGIGFTHEENYFDDFEQEVLLPQKQTSFGPALATADVNGDGLEDFYIGGAKGQEGALYLQTSEGKFTKNANQPWENELASEDVDAYFVDPNNDGHKDLIILSGGSGDMIGSEAWLLDRFYANNGKGEFFRIANVLPSTNSASYAIIAENIDDDPEEELLILGAAKPGQYPRAEKSVLLDYQNKAFVDITEEKLPELNAEDGLIRSAIWVDLDNDGKKDLITAGEWQNIEVYINKDNSFTKASKSWGTSDREGWWRSLSAADIDNDGDIDLVAGNVGKNFKQKASPDHPLYLFSNDYDNNGTLDCVLAKDYKGNIVPARGRQCSSEQMPFISDKFKTYNEFASANIVDILGDDKIEDGIKLKAVDFYSYLLKNEGGKFIFEKLPPLAQASPINDMVVSDYNKDGKDDLLLVGNDYNTEYETPRLDAGNGLILLNKNQGFKSLTVTESGLFSPGDAKKVRKIKYQNKDLFVVANNNNKLDLFLNSN